MRFWNWKTECGKSIAIFLSSDISCITPKFNRTINCHVLLFLILFLTFLQLHLSVRRTVRGCAKKRSMFDYNVYVHIQRQTANSEKNENGYSWSGLWPWTCAYVYMCTTNVRLQVIREEDSMLDLKSQNFHLSLML